MEKVQLVNGIGTTADGKYGFKHEGATIYMNEVGYGNIHTIGTTTGTIFIRPDNREEIHVIF